MLSNCGVGEDSWESLGLQGGQASQSYRKWVLNIHWKDWYWSWNSSTLATWCEKLTHWKRRDTDAGKDWGQEEKGVTDEMVEWHHQHNGHEFEQNLRDSEDMIAWHAAVLGVTKSRTWLSNWTTTTDIFLTKEKSSAMETKVNKIESWVMKQILMMRLPGLWTQLYWKVNLAVDLYMCW